MSYSFPAAQRVASPSFLAIDLGASSGRAVVGTLDGGRMRMEEVHRFRTPLVESNGHLYWDIDGLWSEVQFALQRALIVTPSLASVSIDSWGVDYVALDVEGLVVGRPFAYRDVRTYGRLESVLGVISAQDLYAMTGTQFLPFNTLLQVVADLADDPAGVQRTTTRLLIADYLLFRLSGVMRAEQTLASTTQLYNVSLQSWSQPLIKAIGDEPSRYAPPVAPGTRMGRVRADVLRDASSHRPEVISTCSHDTAAAVAAVPASGTEMWAYISSGTWSLVGVELSAPLLTEAARLAGFTNELGLDNTTRLLKNRTGLWVLEECVREWATGGDHPTWDALHAEATAAEPSGFTIDLNASQFGDRGQMLQKIHEACVAAGSHAPATRGSLVRLVLESLATSYSAVLDELEVLIGVRVTVVHIVGGGARNHLLNQLTADACRRRVIAGPEEATVLGNLLLQARTMGALPESVSLRDAVRQSASLTEFSPQRRPSQQAVALTAH